ncbi:MAG: tyrosyl-tRNA synthase, partial [Verrucomicrobiaceae bacterium]|nr:tyrosyl-tRNA synthase [Verrucomicrobiaceae bacterium]
VELIRRADGDKVHALATPLITKADGTKFGKTESGTIWLDPKRTSVYQFYQFWINTDDRDAVRYLKFFTLLPQDTIMALEVSHTANPAQRDAHKALAKEMTTVLHGEAACRAAEQATAILFGGSVEELTAETFGILRGEVPSGTTTKDQLSAGLPIVEALVATNLSASKGQARKDIEGGGVYVNGVRVTEVTRPVTTADLLHGEGVLLRKGKRAYAVLTAS